MEKISSSFLNTRALQTLRGQPRRKKLHYQNRYSGKFTAIFMMPIRLTNTQTTSSSSPARSKAEPLSPPRASLTQQLELMCLSCFDEGKGCFELPVLTTASSVKQLSCCNNTNGPISKVTFNLFRPF